MVKVNIKTILNDHQMWKLWLMKTILKYLYLDTLLQNTSLEDNTLNPNWSQELRVACLNTPCWCLTVRKWTYDQPHQTSFSSKVICLTKWLFSSTEFFFGNLGAILGILYPSLPYIQFKSCQVCPQMCKMSWLCLLLSAALVATPNHHDQLPGLGQITSKLVFLFLILSFSIPVLTLSPES